MVQVNGVSDSPAQRRPVAPLTIVLGVVFVFFCSVLIFVFVATKRAHPVMLDQQGKPLDSESQPADGKH